MICNIIWDKGIKHLNLSTNNMQEIIHLGLEMATRLLKEAITKLV